MGVGVYNNRTSPLKNPIVPTPDKIVPPGGVGGKEKARGVFCKRRGWGSKCVNYWGVWVLE